MADKAKNELKKQEEVSVQRISEISNKIREAVRAALPAPPEQHFTIMVPGKVINFNDYTEGFEDDGTQSQPILPAVTELNNAMLCDDMPVLGAVQLGPTGRSVSRSYAAALDKLIAKGATVGAEVNDPNNLSDAEKKYKKAMAWLLKEDERNPSKTHLDTYIEKQRVYTAAEERRIRRSDEVNERLMKDPSKTVAQKREEYDTWIRENSRQLKNEVEAAYKDWVVHGRKEEVEYWFSVVDNDSAMARIEASKEAMRNAVVTDSDGVVSYPTVKLTPSNWARIAQKKAKAGSASDNTRTMSQLNWEISLLKKRSRLLETLKENPPKLTQGPVNTQEADSDKEPVREAMKNLINARNASNEADRTNAKDKQQKAADVEKARDELKTALEKYDEVNNDRLKATGIAALEELFAKSASSLQSEIDANEEKIKQLEEERKNMMMTKMGSATDIVASQVGLTSPPRDEATPASPQSVTAPGKTEEEYFIPITVEVAASYEATQASQSTTSFGSSVSARAGMFSVSASMSHSKSSADAAAQMAKSDVKISFECMRVDISRSWLRAELFYDEDLTTAPGQNISPGPMKLAALMDDDNYKNVDESARRRREQEIEMYSSFPMYPTAFLLAANVVLEISGETSSIQSHFDASSTSASAKVGYGPFTASGNYSHSDQHQNSTCETTASGCRITIKSPQIIGWVSEMVPALPRLSENQAPNAPISPRANIAAIGANTSFRAPGGTSEHAQPQSEGSEAHAERA